MLRPEAVQTMIRGVNEKTIVCFDVDSTVITEEGIDVLAAHLGVGDEVAALTANAMGGDMPFEDAIQQRLDLMKPSLADVQELTTTRPPHFTPGVEEFIALLRGKGAQVFLVSGGFRQMIEPIAESLGLHPKDNVIANNLLFNADGSFAGFDREEPTSRSGGKAVALQGLKDQHGCSLLVMVGDGATDLEARPPADAFIGFGGIARRERVEKEADWFVTDFEEVCQCLR